MTAATAERDDAGTARTEQSVRAVPLVGARGSEVRRRRRARSVVARDRDGPVPELRNSRDDPQVVLRVGRQRERAVDVVRRVRALRRHPTAVCDVGHQAADDGVERDRRSLLRSGRRWRRVIRRRWCVPVRAARCEARLLLFGPSWRVWYLCCRYSAFACSLPLLSIVVISERPRNRSEARIRWLRERVFYLSGRQRDRFVGWRPCR